MQNQSEIIQGDCLEVLKTIPSESVDCCVTSPPYWGLRDYGTGEWVGGDAPCPHKRENKHSPKTTTGHSNKALTVGDAIYKDVCKRCGAKRADSQIGLEPTPEAYASHLVAVFREVNRVLAKDGTLWLNLGDSYSGSGGAHAEHHANPGLSKSAKRSGADGSKVKPDSGLKAKDLVGIPWRVAFALQADGWYLRQDIIWHKPNPMPESVEDRCTKSHEYIFLLSKSKSYYFDSLSIREQNSDLSQSDDGRNKRSVWTVNTSSFKGAHFATFPEELIKPCVIAGCREGGIVLDPFFGAGTTGAVAKQYRRHYLGIELNPKYVKMAERRLSNVQMPFL